MSSQLTVQDVELEDLEAIGEIFYAAMQNDYFWLNWYPEDRRPSKEEWAKLYANQAREVFEKERQHGLFFVKCCEAGSTKPMGFARWMSPQFHKHAAAEEAAGEKPKTEAGKKMAEVEDTAFGKRFFGAIKGERKKRFADEKDHWYLALLCVSPEYQRKGVGQALVNYGINQAPPTVPLYLEASPFGKPLYLKNGFHVCGHAEVLGSTKAGPEELRRVEDAEGRSWWALKIPLMLREGSSG